MAEERFVDVGYCLSYCGHQVLEKVKQGLIDGEINLEKSKVYFNSEDDLNQYCLPFKSIEFVVPHYERSNPNEMD